MSRSLALSVAGVALLGVAWMFSTPLLQAPDEASHYLRALTLAQGHLLGPRPRLGPLPRGSDAAAARVRWVARDLREVTVPSALSPSDETCPNGRPDLSGSCIEESYTGDYFPLAYLLPAVAISTARDWPTAMWRSRAGSLVPVLMFLALALILAGPSSRWGRVGLMAATTPSVLFIGSVLNPSGLELAANLAFIAALLRLRRNPAALPRWGWIALGASGAVTILAWQLGPVFALLDLAAGAALMSADGWRVLRRRRLRRLLGTAFILVTATVVFVVWGVSSGVLHSSVSFVPGLNGLRAGRAQLIPTLQGAVGVFGLYSVFLPSAVFKPWWLGVIGLVAGGLWRGAPRDQVVLGLATVTGVGFSGLVLRLRVSEQRLRPPSPVRAAGARPDPRARRRDHRSPARSSSPPVVGRRLASRGAAVRRRPGDPPALRLVVQRAPLVGHQLPRPASGTLDPSGRLGALARRRRAGRRGDRGFGGDRCEPRERGVADGPPEALRSDLTRRGQAAGPRARRISAATAAAPRRPRVIV